MIPVHKSDENLESDENLGSIDLPCNGVLAFSQSKIKYLLTHCNLRVITSCSETKYRDGTLLGYMVVRKDSQCTVS